MKTKLPHPLTETQISTIRQLVESDMFSEAVTYVSRIKTLSTEDATAVVDEIKSPEVAHVWTSVPNSNPPTFVSETSTLEANNCYGFGIAPNPQVRSVRLPNRWVAFNLFKSFKNDEQELTHWEAVIDGTQYTILND